MVVEISGEMVTDETEKNDSDDETKPIHIVRGSRWTFLIASCFSYRVAECFECRSQN